MTTGIVSERGEQAAETDLKADQATAVGSTADTDDGSPSLEHQRAWAGWAVPLARENPHLVAGIAISAAGVAISLLGWYGVAHTTIVAEQTPYVVSGGLLGAALVVLGGIHTIGHLVLKRVDRIEAFVAAGLLTLEDMAGADDRDLGAQAQPAPTTPVGGAVLTLGGGSTFHTSSCPVVEGKQPRAISRSKAESEGRRPCQICAPA